VPAAAPFDSLASIARAARSASRLGQSIDQWSLGQPQAQHILRKTFASQSTPGLPGWASSSPQHLQTIAAEGPTIAPAG
jgi:hypothetical protein